MGPLKAELLQATSKPKSVRTLSRDLVLLGIGVTLHMKKKNCDHLGYVYKFLLSWGRRCCFLVLSFVYSVLDDMRVTLAFLTSSSLDIFRKLFVWLHGCILSQFLRL